MNNQDTLVDKFSHWLGDFSSIHAQNIVIILFMSFFARHVSKMLIRRIVKRTLKPHKYKTVRDERLREQTLISTISAAVSVIIVVITFLLLLSEIGIDIAPLLAGAGIAGVALGFGAQSMVRDFLAGMFILLENQYRVGDVIRINTGEVSGRVENVTLRTTVLRDMDGMQHHIPNGVISIATNMTMDYSNINLDIGVAYDTDIDKLEKIINRLGEEMADDETWGKKILEAPKFLRINDFSASAITIKIVGKTEPMEQWDVSGEYRKRLKLAFEKAGIEIPFPQSVIHQAKERPAKKK